MRGQRAIKLESSGGGNQIFVSEPSKIKDLEVINEIPIK